MIGAGDDGWLFKTLDNLEGKLVYETDEQLRARVWYVAADGERLQREIQGTQGAYLDELASRFGLVRRRVT